MSAFSTFMRSSLGKKYIMGLSGLFLGSFLVVHLTINLFLLKSDAGHEFDAYAEFMATYPLVRPLEIVLFGGFLLHAIIGVWLWLTNRLARPQKYAAYRNEDNAKLPSRITFITGGFVLLFLIIHVNTFFVKSRFFPSGETMYDLVVEAFKNPLYDAFYIVALGFLAYHLKHGFQSAFQSLGLRVVRYRGLIDAVGILFWLVIPVGFAILPIYFFLQHLWGAN